MLSSHFCKANVAPISGKDQEQVSTSWVEDFIIGEINYLGLRDERYTSPKHNV